MILVSYPVYITAPTTQLVLARFDPLINNYLLSRAITFGGSRARFDYSDVDILIGKGTSSEVNRELSNNPLNEYRSLWGSSQWRTL